MNTFKTLVVLTVLMMVGYGLYVGLNNGFQFQPSQTETPDWLKQEMDTESGTPQVGPPQVTLQPGQESSVANSVSLGQPVVAVPASVPQAEYPASPNKSLSADHRSQPTAPTAPSVTPVVPLAIAPKTSATTTPVATPSSTSVAPTPVAITPPPASGQNKPAAQFANSNENTLEANSSGNSNVSMSLPAAVGVVPDVSLDDKLNIDQNLAFTTALKLAKMQLQQGQLATALLTLSIWYEDPRLKEPQQIELTQLLDEVAGSVIYSRKHLIEPAYTVRQGETLKQIAQSHRVTVGLLIKINGIQNPQNLTPGDQLKVVRGPFNATVNGEKSELTLWLGGRYAGRFPLAMGPEFKSIVGPFVVHEKTRMHPERGDQPWIWLTPGYGTTSSIPPTDPQVGIAGMQQPAIAKQGATPGQIGVSVRDADDLFDILSKGSKVTIQR